MHDDDIASALNDGDSSELESLTSEDDGWTDCEDDEEEEIIEERSINNNAVELVQFSLSSYSSRMMKIQFLFRNLNKCCQKNLLKDVN